MPMKPLRTAAFAICLALLMLALTGCDSADRLSPRDPVTLSMWHNYGGDMQQTMDLLIDEFNATIGKEKGITINVTAISSSSDLNRSLEMIANGDPGAPDMPDIFTGYPRVAAWFVEKEKLLPLDKYFTEDELSQYIGAFVQEGRFADGNLYVFPVAKSTEVLYLNQTLFDAFAEATGAEVEMLSTFEGLAQLSRMYYEWSGGKHFFTADDWFNLAAAGMAQLGAQWHDESGNLLLDNDAFRRIFETLYAPVSEGGFALYDGYSSDLSKTGDIICSTGSSAGILFYGDTITYADGTVKDVEYSILPYPVFEGGENWAIQRGGGLMISKSSEKRALAATEFIKWLTAPEQNMRFIASTGYLPVTKLAFEEELPAHLESLEDARIKKMLTTVLTMYEEYDFFTMPNLPELESASDRCEQNMMRMFQRGREANLSGNPITAAEALTDLIAQD